MKLIIQSDDFGVTRGVSYGTLDAMEHGHLSCTGIFVNTIDPCLATSLCTQHPDICIGLDLNATCGSCVADPASLPHLVDAQGKFEKVKQRYTKEELTSLEANIKDEIYMEVKAQYERFLTLTNRKPEYLHEHAIGQEPPGYLDAIRRLSKETKVPFTMDIFETFNIQGMKSTLKNSLQGKPYTTNWQLENSSLNFFQQHGDELLKHEIAILRLHAGFVDADLFQISSYHIMRLKDHELLTSTYLDEWLTKHQVELISYRDLFKKEMIG